MNPLLNTFWRARATKQALAREDSLGGCISVLV